MNHKRELIDKLNHENVRLKKWVVSHDAYLKRNQAELIRAQGDMLRCYDLAQKLAAVPDELVDYIYLAGYRHGEKDS